MFNGRLEEAVTFYSSVFTDAKVENVSDQSATFELCGQRFLAFNGGDHFSFSDGISLFVDCADQQEVDFYWEKLSANGGEKGYCGWLKDAFGVSWQVIPKALGEYLGGEDKAGASRAMEAMLKMTKIEVEVLKNAYAGTN